MNINRILLTVIASLAFTLLVAQPKRLDANGNEVTPYYIELTPYARKNLNVIEVSDSSLNLRYHDYIGKAKVLKLSVYNWKREKVLEHELEKEFGVNYFQIALPSPWKYNEVFRCELLDEEGKKYTASIRWVLPKVIPVEASIQVNPKYIECDSPQGNLVEYYADISGGQPPYQVNWYVLNEQRTQLLYYPRSEKLKDAGISPSIEVDRPAKYSVLLYVKDACGTESKRAVTLTCDNGQKQINSIMFEPIDHTTLPPVKAGN